MTEMRENKEEDPVNNVVFDIDKIKNLYEI